MALHGNYSQICSNTQVTEQGLQGFLMRASLDRHTEGLIACAQANAVLVQWYVKHIFKQDSSYVCRMCNQAVDTLELMCTALFH